MPDFKISIIPPQPITLKAGVAPAGSATTAFSSAILGRINASIDLSGHRAVTIDTFGELIYASNDGQAAIGILTGAVLSGSEGAILTTGTLTEPSWAWTPGDVIFLGLNGQLTTTPPTTGIYQRLAIALSSTKIDISMKEPVYR